jgi:predicted GNAT family N-acyltransferase
MKIRQLSSNEEILQVAELRYDCLVRERGYEIADADHVNHRICDAQDQTGYLFGAFVDEQLVGTIRTSFLSENDDEFNYELFQFDRLPADMQMGNVASTCRLMVRKQFRNCSVALRLCCTAYQFGLENGITHDLIYCPFDLVNMYQSLGYRIHRESISHPDFGRIAVLYLALDDGDHLKSVGSPFYRAYASRELCAA